MLHHWCSTVSIGAYAGLQLGKPHSQSWQQTVPELDVLPKKFTYTTILFDM